MQRNYVLEPNEQREMSTLEQENTQTLAQVGALMMDLETAKQRLATVQEKQRSFIRAALANRKVEQFQEARVLNGQIVVQVPDEMIPAPLPPALAPAPGSHVNGSVDPSRSE